MVVCDTDEIIVPFKPMLADEPRVRVPRNSNRIKRNQSRKRNLFDSQLEPNISETKKKNRWNNISLEIYPSLSTFSAQPGKYTSLLTQS